MAVCPKGNTENTPTENTAVGTLVIGLGVGQGDTFDARKRLFSDHDNGNRPNVVLADSAHIPTPGGRIRQARSDLAAASHLPSTMDTVNTNGSAQPAAEMEGDMWVRKGNLWKRWRLRHASIVNHQFFGRVLCLLSYDTSGKLVSSKSEIIVLHDALCRATRETVELGGEEQHVFVLRTTKEHNFAASSDAVRRQWIRDLRQAAKAESPRMVEDRAKASMTPLPDAPVRTQRVVGSSKFNPIGRAATHTGAHRPVSAQSGDIQAVRLRRGPFRRAGQL
jgi:PH domain